METGALLFIFASFWLWTAGAVYLITAPARYDGDDEDRPSDSPSSPKNETKPAARKPDLSTTVLVLGDIGRSPRMQYHAISLAKHGAKVELIGHNESDIHPSLQGTPLVTVRGLAKTPYLLTLRSRFILPFVLPLKALHQALSLYWTLAIQSSPTRYILLQNPPSIPTIVIALVTAALRNQRLIIDWHNLGFSVLAQRLGQSHLLVRIARLYELKLARYAWAHFAVSTAMSTWLRENAGITAPGQPLVLHDRPADIFQPFTSSSRRSDFLRKLSDTKEYAGDIVKGKWRLIVSSTSWSDDEDFSLLLDALVAYSSQANVDDFLGKKIQVPKLLVIITGKGPKRDFYLDRISQLNQDNKLSQAVVRTAWLSAQDYAGLLAAADLGISLHQSTSGIDLPMKVVDMFGAGLPVAGYSKFPAWSELVHEGINGVGFETSKQLEAILIRLLASADGTLEKLREGAVKEGQRRWDDEWDSVAGNLLRDQ